MQWCIKELMELKQVDIFNNVYQSQVKAVCHIQRADVFLKNLVAVYEENSKLCPEFGHVILVATNGNASFLAALNQAKACVHIHV